MKFPTESKMRIWSEELKRVRKLNIGSPAETPTPGFSWTNTYQTLPNPYKQNDDEDTDDEDMMSHSGDALPSVRPPPPGFPLALPNKLSKMDPPPRLPTGNKDKPGGNWL